MAFCFSAVLSLSLSQPEMESRVNGVSSLNVQDRGPLAENSGEKLELEEPRVLRHQHTPIDLDV